VASQNQAEATTLLFLQKSASSPATSPPGQARLRREGLTVRVEVWAAGGGGLGSRDGRCALRQPVEAVCEHAAFLLIKIGTIRGVYTQSSFAGNKFPGSMKPL
jgi:hypothetical protein